MHHFLLRNMGWLTMQREGAAMNKRVSKLVYAQKCQVYALVLCGVDFDEIALHFGVTRRTVQNINRCSKTNYEHVFTEFMFRGSKLAFCQFHLTSELEQDFPDLKLPPKGE
jgi:hypothetical protein